MKDKEHRKEELANIRNLKVADLESRITEVREQLMWLRVKRGGEQTEKPSNIRKFRHTLARLNTVLREKQIEAKEKTE